MLIIPAAATAQRSADGRVYERWVYINNKVSDGDSICQVYITHLDDPDWGPDLLGQYCVDPGESMRVDPGWQEGYCRMDVKIVMLSGQELFIREDICSRTDITVVSQ
jgi:hypothetical protein